MFNRFNYKTFLITSFFILHSHTVQATTTLPFIHPFGVKPVLSFVTGASITNTAGSQSIQPVDLCAYNYTQNHSSLTQAVVGGFLGTQFTPLNQWAFTAGIGYYQSFGFSSKGTLIQGADAASADAYNYQYKVQTQQVLLEGRAAFTRFDRIQPFVMLGMGAAINKMYNFETNVSPFYAFTPTFSSHTQTNFTYSVGPGIDVVLSKSFRLGVGYRFADLGPSTTSSGQMDGIAFTSQLKQSHIYENQILGQLTFIP